MEDETDRLLLQCVEDGLLMLGEDGKSVILWWWETKRNKRKKDIPSHIEEFVGLLDEIFGSGARIIEGSITKEVQRAFRLPDGNGADLSSAVKAARNSSADRIGKSYT